MILSVLSQHHITEQLLSWMILSALSQHHITKQLLSWMILSVLNLNTNVWLYLHLFISDFVLHWCINQDRTSISSHYTPKDIMRRRSEPHWLCTEYKTDDLVNYLHGMLPLLQDLHYRSQCQRSSCLLLQKNVTPSVPSPVTTTVKTDMRNWLISWISCY